MEKKMTKTTTPTNTTTKVNRNQTVSYEKNNVNQNQNRKQNRKKNMKTNYPEFSSIHEAENFVNEEATRLEKKIDNRWVGLLVEAVPTGYRVTLEKNKEEFLKKVNDPKYRHWA